MAKKQEKLTAVTSFVGYEGQVARGDALGGRWKV
jgi:hypothetical protein